jgi:hypothetical protein
MVFHTHKTGIVCCLCCFKECEVIDKNSPTNVVKNEKEQVAPEEREEKADDLTLNFDPPILSDEGEVVREKECAEARSTEDNKVFIFKFFEELLNTL